MSFLATILTSTDDNTSQWKGVTLDKYIVKGGKKLYGEVEISGAKNAAVAIIPAAILIHRKKVRNISLKM